MVRKVSCLGQKTVGAAGKVEKLAGVWGERKGKIAKSCWRIYIGKWVTNSFKVDSEARGAAHGEERGGE